MVVVSSYVLDGETLANIGRGANVPLVSMNILGQNNHTALLLHNSHPVQKS